ncbi:MAG: matrixin family metalloprotease [Candidatus Moranbacteria bacterium]|nr:matrixin family metalloprotease [Candidatus Moranbacteria bacterium]
MRKFLVIIVVISLATLSLKVYFDEHRNTGFGNEIQNGRTLISKIPMFKKTVCDRTLEYSIGNFDERFGISEEEFLSALRESERVWEDAIGRNLFEYNPQASFQVSLIFDERQKQSMENDVLGNDYEKLVAVQGEISQEYKNLEAEYNSFIEIYNKEVKEYEKEVSQYNSEVEKWNKEGGAPSKEYKKLEKKSEELKEWYLKIEKEIDEINDLAKKINELAKKENELISNFNENVETYRERYGEAQEFNQGEYDGQGISVYQFREMQDLILVLTHEFGHALILGHAQNPQSIMYYLMEQQDLENVKLTQEDINALKTVCELK